MHDCQKGIQSIGPTWPNMFPIVHQRDREQSEPNRDDKTPWCDYLSEYLRLHEDSLWPFFNISDTLRKKQDS